MWTITNDLVDGGKKAGASSCTFDATQAVWLKHRFRLLDDDGNIYYEGISDNHDSQKAFSPLDDFGRGYAGCTQIEYFTNGAWRSL